MRRRRICILTGGHWSAAKGGLPYQALCLAEFLAEQDDVEVFYLARDVDPAYKPSGYGLETVAGPTWLHRLGFFVDAPRLLSKLRAFRPDAIYQRGLQAYTGVAAAYSLRYQARFVFHVASDYDLIPLRDQRVGFHPGIASIERRIGEYGLRRAHGVITQTREQAELLWKNFNRRSTTIGNFHPAPNRPIRKRTDCTEVVWIGNFKPFKRPELFVALADNLREYQNLRFTMIGSTGRGESYRGLLAQCESIPRLDVLGPQSREQIEEILSRAHVLVSTSEFEGFSNTFIEAWMREVPVFTLGLNPDGVFDNEACGICAASCEELRAAVVKISGSPGLLARMALASRELAMERYSMRNAALLAAELLGENAPNE